VGEGFETFNKLKKIFSGEKRRMDDTCAMENFWNILLKLNLKCEFRKVGGSHKSIKEQGNEEEGYGWLAYCYAAEL
jgi:hypothetical protein